MTNSTTRAAWLVLGSLSVPLDNPDAGWICTELDLGYPDVRDVTNPNPVAHGLVDRTKYFGGRTVSAKITAFTGGTMPLDVIVEQFAPFLDVSARPELHYLTDGNLTERVLILRASAWSAPMDTPPERPFQMTWVAPDPIAQGAASEQTQTTAWSGGASGGGRTYPLTFNRVYPAGGGAPVAGLVLSDGDIAVQPYLRIFGPITGAAVTFVTQISGQTFLVPMLLTNRIDAAHFIGIDTAKHTAYLDDDITKPVLNMIDWTRLIWPVLPVAPDQSTVTLTGQNTTGVTQVLVTWRDRYLT
jgi:hypothetical protein